MSNNYTLSEEYREQVDAMVDDWKQLFVAKHESQPSGRAITAKRREFELTFVPLSEIVRRMVVIGDPDKLGGRKVNADEFSKLQGELDRREGLYLKCANSGVNSQISD